MTTLLFAGLVLYGFGWLNTNMVDGAFLKLLGLSMTSVKKNAP